MIALDIETLAAIRHRPDENGFPRPIVIARIGLGGLVASVALQRHEIKDGRGELADVAILLMRDVAGHSQGLQVDLRPHHRRTKIQQHTAFQPGDRLSENQKIMVAASSQGGAIAVGMFVNDVVTDADVDRHRHAEPYPGGKDAQVTVRKIAIEDRPANRFAVMADAGVSVTQTQRPVTPAAVTCLSVEVVV